jgi:hypothetical protein
VVAVGNTLPHVVVHQPAIGKLIMDFSREMGDTKHLASNISQADRIFRESGLGIDDFFTTASSECC